MTMVGGIAGAPVGALGGFSLSERDRRWRTTRALMDDMGVDLLVVFPNFIPGDAIWIANQTGVVLFPKAGEPVILLGGEDAAIERERPPGWIADRRFIGVANSVCWGQATAEHVQQMDLHGQTVAVAGLAGDNYLHMHNPEGYVNFTTVKSTLAAIPASTKIVNGTPILSRARYVKSDEEIAHIRESLRLGESVAATIQRELRVGRSQAAVFMTAMLSVAESGAQAQFGWCPGKWGEPRPRLVMAPPGLVEDGLYLSTEIVVPRGNYAGQVAQCFVVGLPNEEAKALFEVNRAAFDAACTAMQPGATWGQVVDATQRAAEGSGSHVEMILHGVGSGPLITPYNSHEPVQDDVLVESTTFVLKPCAVPNGKKWFARSLDVSWGDMVVVRRGGAERLGTRPFALLQSG